MSEKYNLFVDSLVFLFSFFFITLTFYKKKNKKKTLIWHSENLFMGIFLQKKEKKIERIKREQKKTSHVNKNVTGKMQLYIRFDLTLAQISNSVKLLSICECFHLYVII